jgi:hypothetical protein
MFKIIFIIGIQERLGVRFRYYDTVGVERKSSSRRINGFAIASDPRIHAHFMNLSGGICRGSCRLGGTLTARG